MRERSFDWLPRLNINKILVFVQDICWAKFPLEKSVRIGITFRYEHLAIVGVWRQCWAYKYELNNCKLGTSGRCLSLYTYLDQQEH